MPLTLPVPFVAQVRKSGEEEIIYGYRSISFRVEVLDKAENLIKILDGVSPGGSLRWSAQASVKGSGDVVVSDLNQDVDWLNARLKFYYITEDDYAKAVTTPLGIFLCAAPVSDWENGQRTWNVELTDKSGILDTDIVTGPNGEAETYSLPAGTNVIDAVQAIIADSGERTPAMVPDDEALLASNMTWEAGTTRLKIINDMLDAANYFSIWCDGQGQFQCIKYKPPSERAQIYDIERPFTEGDSSLMEDKWQHDKDIYGVPNRLVALQTGDGETEGLWAVAEVEDPESPYHFDNRGRWVTQVNDNVEAVDQAALDAYAERNLASALAVTSKIIINHVYLPELLVNTVVKFKVADVDLSCSISNTDIPLDPNAMVTTTMREVTDSVRDEVEG